MAPVCSYLDPEKLELYSLGMLKEQEEEEVELHLLVCNSCQGTAAEVEGEIMLLRMALLE